MNLFVVWLMQISEWLGRPAAWGIFLAGAVIYLVAEWRIRYLAMVIQFLFNGVMFLRVFDSRPEMALMKIMVGWLISAALMVSARIRETSLDSPVRPRWSRNLPFRVLTLTAVTVVAYLASETFTLPFVSADVGLACFLLLVLAILFFGTEEQDPAIVGVGVLNLLAALDMFYSAQEPGLLVSGMLAVVSLLAGLACSYLTVSEVKS